MLTLNTFVLVHKNIIIVRHMSNLVFASLYDLEHVVICCTKTGMSLESFYLYTNVYERTTISFCNVTIGVVKSC